MKQKYTRRCECGRSILIGHLRTYNGENKNVCPQCNAEAIIADTITSYHRNDDIVRDTE